MSTHVNAIILSVVAVIFFVAAVKTGNPWAQMMAYAAFSSACVAMQIPTKPGGGNAPQP